MKFAYTMDQVLRCGGVRVAFEHCRELKRRGHDAAIYHSSVVGEGIQDWVDRYQVQLRPWSRLNDGIDVLVSVWWRQLDELATLPIKQKFHLVQGRDRLSYPANHEWLPLLEKQINRQDFKYLAVSHWAGNGVRNPTIVPNGVDSEFWRPAPFTKLSPKFRILIEASTGDVYKGVAEAEEVVKRFTDPSVEVVRLMNAPHDVAILSAYQNTDVLLKTTHFDGFGLPHLEAMSCGLPLVTTEAGGNMSFCVNDRNCLTAKVGDIDGLYRAVNELFRSKKLRERLAQGGRMTARQHTWQHSIDCLLGEVTSDV